MKMRMNSIKKNQLIISALAIMIVLAAYLNFTKTSDIDEGQYVFNNESNLFDEVGNNNILVKEALVPNADDEYVTSDAEVETEEDVEGTEVTDETVKTNMDIEEESTEGQEISDDAKEVNGDIASNDGSNQIGEAVFVSSGAVDDTYFLDSRIKREQKRAARIEILEDVIENQNLSEESKMQAISKMIDIQENMEKEAQAEAMLEAKGYDEVFVLIDETTVDVIVRSEELSQSQLAEIADVTSRKTGIALDDVIIYPTK